MGKYKNSEILGSILRSLYSVAGRRTTKNFAAKVIGSITKTLEPRYDFLKYIKIDNQGQLIDDKVITIAPDIDSVEPERIGKAIETIIRVVYMDIIGKAGLFFVTELKRTVGEEIISELRNFGVDLASLQIEQHYLHRSRERKKKKAKVSGVSLLGYTWKNVASWKYDPNQNTCVLYDKDGKVLDNLHLESIIENYVKDLSESLEELPEELENKATDITDLELKLLEMLRYRDMDAKKAMTLLHISKEEFSSIVKGLLENELLQYTSYNIIELTEVGISYLSKKNEKVKVENKQIAK